MTPICISCGEEIDMVDVGSILCPACADPIATDEEDDWDVFDEGDFHGEQ
jgi:hypothetical protein